MGNGFFGFAQEAVTSRDQTGIYACLKALLNSEEHFADPRFPKVFFGLAGFLENKIEAAEFALRARNAAPKGSNLENDAERNMWAYADESAETDKAWGVNFVYKVMKDLLPGSEQWWQAEEKMRAYVSGILRTDRTQVTNSAHDIRQKDLKRSGLWKQAWSSIKRFVVKAPKPVGPDLQNLVNFLETRKPQPIHWKRPPEGAFPS